MNFDVSYSGGGSGGNNDGGELKLGTHMPYMSGNMSSVIWPSPECVIPGRTLFGEEGEEEEDILTEPPPDATFGRGPGEEEHMVQISPTSPPSKLQAAEGAFLGGGGEEEHMGHISPMSKLSSKFLFTLAPHSPWINLATFSGTPMQIHIKPPSISPKILPDMLYIPNITILDLLEDPPTGSGAGKGSICIRSRSG
ncbi:hypothetical protein BC629DRAFT_1445633 [Irpex lacteus]|nr:hypothetical protein BC629DRAFT_1445633 [Irpex lacteus]